MLVVAGLIEEGLEGTGITNVGVGVGAPISLQAMFEKVPGGQISNLDSPRHTAVGAFVQFPRGISELGARLPNMKMADLSVHLGRASKVLNRGSMKSRRRYEVCGLVRGGQGGDGETNNCVSTTPNRNKRATPSLGNCRHAARTATAVASCLYSLHVPLSLFCSS